MDARRLVMLSLVLCLGMPGIGRAQQRPLVTEDPETVGTSRVLLEGGLEIDTNQLYSAYGLKGDTLHTATLGVSLGVSPSTEIQIDGGLRQRLHVDERQAAPLAHTLDFTGDRSSTFEDFTVATKIRIASESETHPAFGVRFGARLPMAKHETGLGLETTDLFAALLVGRTVRSVRTVGNVSFLLLGNPEQAQEPVHGLGFGLSVARALTNAFEIVGEVNGRLKPWGEADPAGLEDRGSLRVAGRYTYGLFRLDLGMLVGLTERDPDFGISVGATYVIAR